MGRRPRLCDDESAIDAENVSYRHAPQILRIAKSLGSLQLKKAYGDFTQSWLQSWREPMDRHQIRPHNKWPYTTEKNCADQALIDDARSLLGTGRFQAYVIASTDSDFTAIARRVVAAGAVPYGIGDASAKTPYREALRRYFELPHIPTIKQFREAVFDWRRRDFTSHNVDVVPVEYLHQPPPGESLSGLRHRNGSVTRGFDEAAVEREHRLAALGPRRDAAHRQSPSRTPCAGGPRQAGRGSPRTLRANRPGAPRVRATSSRAKP